MKLTDRLGAIEDLDFSFDYSPCPRKNIMTVDNLSFSYSGSAPYLIDSFSFTLHASDKICIIGRNGAGKSTLLRLLNRKLSALTGEIKTHPRTRITSFDQADAVDLHSEHTIEEEILSSLPVGDRGKARSICGTMLFSQDNALKRIAILSGGEKCRVMLGKVVAAPANLLMLDEPTHHLDMESCHAIIHSLREFEGAALIVTHDEYFLREVATKLIVLQGDQVRLFLGTYEEFLEQVGWIKEEQRKKNQETVKTVNKAERRREKAARRELYNKTVKPLKRATERLEKEIAAMEEDHTRITRELITASEEQIVPDILRLNRELAELERETNQKYEDYYRVHAKYEDKLSQIKTD